MASTAVCKILVLCLIQVAVEMRNFNDLRVKTNVFGLDKSEAFFSVPKTTKSQLIKDYVKVKPEASFRFQMDFYCKPKDPRVCFMYDRKGNIAGVQISILKADIGYINENDYDYDAIEEWSHTNFFGTPAYSSRVYFTNPEKLTASGRRNTGEVAEGLWAYLDNNKLVQIQRQEPTGPRVGDFYRQGCYPAMGQHYIYKYHKNASCKHHFSLFPLYEKGGLVGFGISSPGRPTKYRTDWYEVPDGPPMGVILPDQPPCQAGVAQYGYVSVHVFLVDNPWDISCPRRT